MSIALGNSWLDLPPRPGTYALLLRLERTGRLAVGRLGRYEFPPGWYIYVGSARGTGGLRARLRHHWESGARPHWHVDFLSRTALPVQVAWRIGAARAECLWAAALGSHPDAQIVAPGFGASDCHCETHLYYFLKRPDPRRLASALCQKY